MSDSSTAETSAPSTVSNVVGSVATDLKNAAGQKYEETRAAVASQASDAKAAVAGEVMTMATALRRASQDLRGGSLPEVTIGLIANNLADASDAVRDKDFGQLLQSVNKAARNNPVLFVGGAILLGFAVSRFAKATSDLPPHLLTKEGRHQAGHDDFISEGNPNTDPSDSLP